MNKNDLFNAIGELDDDILERSDSAKSYKRPLYIRFALIAACLCTLFSVLAVELFQNLESDKEKSDAESSSDIHSDAIDIGKPTSEKYKTLGELLADLSKNDNHKNTLGSGVTTSSDSDGIEHLSQVYIRGEYQFIISDYYHQITQVGNEIRHENIKTGDKVYIQRIDENGYYTNIVNHDIDAKSFMLYKDILIAKNDSVISFYDITDLSNPSLITEFAFETGASVYRVEDELYFTFSDGVCACGWSRTDDMSEYYPSYSRDGKADKWGDENISILGEPTRVDYVAVMKLSLETLEVIDKRAYYGDIEEFNYGPDWFTVTTKTNKKSDGYVLNPDVYTFDTTKALKHTGKVDVSDVFGRDKKVPYSEKGYANHIRVLSVAKIDGKFRIIGAEYIRYPKPDVIHHYVLMAMEADMANERYVSAELYLDYANSEFNQRLNEKDRTILTVNYKDNNDKDPYRNSTFIFIEFSDERVDIIPSNLTVERVEGINSSGGITNAIVPIDNGIYIRYNSDHNGFNVYDFSDSKNPKLLSAAVPLIGENDFNSFSWIKYSENLFGVARGTLSDPKSETSTKYYDIYWDIYSFDPTSKTPFTLIESKQVFSYTSRTRFAIKNFDGTYYIVEYTSIEPVMPSQ